MVPTYTITCTANGPDGTLEPGAIFRFELVKTNDRGQVVKCTERYEGFLVPRVIEVEADASGVATVNLFPNALGTENSLYRVTATSAVGGLKFLNELAVVPEENSNLHEITISTAPGVPSPGEIIGAVRYNVTQALDGGQQAQARENIGFLAAVRATVLTGLSTATNAVIAATDTVLEAFGKLQAQVAANLATLTGHTGNISNPHSVTKIQVGLGSADDTSDADKPVSSATQTALNLKADSSALTTHTGNTSNPHGVTAAQVGADPTGTASAAVAAHEADATAVHAASAISNTPAGNIAATDVQAAINELDAEKLGIAGLGTGVATALAVNVGSAGAPVVNGGALGTPSSGTVTNLTGTASININGTVGATTPAAGAFTTLSANSLKTVGAPLGGFAADSWFIQNETASTQRSYSCGTNGSTYGTWEHYVAYSTGTPVKIFTASSTGLAVTGALSATGVVSLTDTTDASTLGAGALQTGGGLSVAKQIWTGGNQFNVAPVVSYEMVHRGTGGWDFYTDSATKLPFRIERLAPTNTCVVGVSGLTVTGAVSATGAGAFSTVKVGGGSATPSAYLANVTASGTETSLELYQTGVESWKLKNPASTTDLILAQSGVARVTWTGATGLMNVAAGLAVTGALSATGTLSGGTSGTGYSLSGSAPAGSLTLDAGGNLLLNASSYTTVNENSIMFNPATGFTQSAHISGTASGAFYSAFMYNAIGIGSVTQSGTTAVAYNTTSDHRLKENVRPADAYRFMDIEFVDFEWVDGRHDCGVIADQLQSVYPDLVIGAKDATEVRTIEIAPAVTERRLVSPAIPAVEAVEAQDAVEASIAEYTTVTTEELVLVDGVETTLTRSGLVETKPAVAARAAIEAVAAAPAVEAVYETVVITPAVTEEQTFPVYQQVNHMGLIGRMGTRVQILQRTVDAQAALIEAMEARLTALEQA